MKTKCQWKNFVVKICIERREKAQRERVVQKKKKKLTFSIGRHKMNQMK